MQLVEVKSFCSLEIMLLACRISLSQLALEVRRVMGDSVAYPELR